MKKSLEVTVNKIEFGITIDGTKHVISMEDKEEIKKILQYEEQVGAFLVNLVGDLSATWKKAKRETGQ